MKRDKEAAGNVENFLLPLLEYQSFCLSDSFFYHWSDDHGDDHFYQVGRDEWDYADCESSFESVICNQAEPYSSEEVAYDRSDDHTDKLDPWLMAVINYQSGNDGHNDKSDDVSASRTCKFGRAACESRKYRKADQAKQKIDQITNRSSFPSEKIQGQIDCQVGE